MSKDVKFQMKNAIFFGLLGLLLYSGCILDNSGQGTGSVAGIVCDAKDSTGLGGVLVRLVGTQNSTQTDSTGKFALSGLPAGEVFLHLKQDGYLPLTRSITLSEGQQLVLSDSIFLSRDYGVLAGVVLNVEDSTCLEGVVVQVQTVCEQVVTDSTTTDANGSFVLGPITPDTNGCIVTIHKTGYAPLSYQDTIKAGDSIFVTQNLYPYRTVVGVVYESDSATPVVGAMVTAGGSTVISDSLGKFVLTNLASVDTGYQFYVTIEYFLPLLFRDTITNTDTLIGPFYMQRESSVLHGTVRLQGQNNHSGIVVQLGSSGFTDTTDSFGYVCLPDIPAGKQPILVSKQNFSTLTDTIELKGKDTTRIAYDLVIQSGRIQTRVDWNSTTLPYNVQDTLEVTTGGTLYVHPGTEIAMRNKARLLGTGDGVIRMIGQSHNLIMINPATSADTNILAKIPSVGNEVALSYVFARNIEMNFGEAKIEHCLFVHTDDSDTGCSVCITSSEEGTYFNQCDFVRINSNRKGIAIQDSIDATGVVFRNCIFYLSADPSGCTNFIASENMANNVETVVTNCNFYSDCSLTNSLLGLANADTSNVSQLEPGYVDPALLDFRLKETSELLNKAIGGGHLGALGLDGDGSSGGEK